MSHHPLNWTSHTPCSIDLCVCVLFHFPVSQVYLLSTDTTTCFRTWFFWELDHCHGYLTGPVLRFSLSSSTLSIFWLHKHKYGHITILWNRLMPPKAFTTEARRLSQLMKPSMICLQPGCFASLAFPLAHSAQPFWAILNGPVLLCPHPDCSLPTPRSSHPSILNLQPIHLLPSCARLPFGGHFLSYQFTLQDSRR